MVSTVFNSLNEIAFGRIGKAAGFILGSLIKAVPIVISFLARLLNISGIVKKVQQVIGKIKKPVDKAVGKVVGWVVKKGKALWAKVKGVFGKKEKPPKNDAEREAQVKAGLAALDSECNKVDKDNNNKITLEEAQKVANKVKNKYPVFKSITVVDAGSKWDFEYVFNPKRRHSGKKGKEAGRLVSQLNAWKKAHPKARLINQDNIKLTPEQEKIYIKAQEDAMNELNKKGAKYGDGSSAFLVMLEQFKGGVGKEPVPVVGNTKHYVKCIDFLGKLNEYKNHKHMHSLAKERLQQEIDKIQDAIQWADNYRAGNSPSLPRWAKNYSDLFV